MEYPTLTQARTWNNGNGLFHNNCRHSLSIYLEGITKVTHENLTRVGNSFFKTIEAVKYLKSNNIHTHTNTTITRSNLDECELFPAFIKEELDLDKFSMNLIIPTGSGLMNHGLFIGYNEIGFHLERIIEQSKKHNVEFMWYSPVPMCMFNSIIHGLGNKGCSACDGLISIAPDGAVLPCASYDDPVGNSGAFFEPPGCHHQALLLGQNDHMGTVCDGSPCHV